MVSGEQALCVCGGGGVEGKLEKPIPAPEACPLVGLSLSIGPRPSGR